MYTLLMLAGLCSAAPGMTEVATLRVRAVELAGARQALPLLSGERLIRQVAVSSPPGGHAPEDVTARLRIPGGLEGVVFPALIRQGTIPLPDGGTMERTAFIGNLRREGDDLVTETVRPMDGGQEDLYSIVELKDSCEWALPPVLRPDPLDPAPRGDRGMLVLVHGLDRDTAGTSSHAPGKVMVWDTLRTTALRQRVAAGYKIYLYEYPTYRTTRENGLALAQLIRQQAPDLTDGQLAFCAHSMGAQVARHAAASPALARQVGVIVTFAGVHHGTILASLMFANARIIERVGPGWWIVLKGAAMWEPDTPGLRSLWWDNFDGSVSTAERERYGIPINEELAAFNRSDPNSARTVTLQGDIRSLVGKGPFFGMGEELIRRGAAAYSPLFANIDPLVPLESGLFQGTNHPSYSYPDLDHFELVAKPETWQDVIPILEALRQPRRAHSAD